MFSIFKRNKEQTSARELKRYYKIVDQLMHLKQHMLQCQMKNYKA